MVSKHSTRSADLLTDPTECPYYLISRVSLAITSVLKQAFGDAGIERLRPAYMGVLLVLWREDGLKVIDLGRRAGLEPSTMTGLIDRMERDGLVKRVADPTDRRVLRIQLTDTARALQTPALEVVDRVLAAVLSGVNEPEIATLKAILRKVLANVHEEARDGVVAQ